MFLPPTSAGAVKLKPSVPPVVKPMSWCKSITFDGLEPEEVRTFKICAVSGEYPIEFFTWTDIL